MSAKRGTIKLLEEALSPSAPALAPYVSGIIRGMLALHAASKTELVARVRQGWFPEPDSRAEGWLMAFNTRQVIDQNPSTFSPNGRYRLRAVGLQTIAVARHQVRVQIALVFPEYYASAFDFAVVVLDRSRPVLTHVVYPARASDAQTGSLGPVDYVRYAVGLDAPVGNPGRTFYNKGAHPDEILGHNFTAILLADLGGLGEYLQALAEVQ